MVAKPGLDGHDRGAQDFIARALRDAGMEVIYTGLHQTPEQIVETVIQEDADAIGLSILSGAHMTLVPRVMEGSGRAGGGRRGGDGGGHDPQRRRRGRLKRLGVAEVFTPGAPTQEAVEFIRDAVAQRAGDPAGRQTQLRSASQPTLIDSSGPTKVYSLSTLQPPCPLAGTAAPPGPPPRAGNDPFPIEAIGGDPLKICVLVKEVPTPPSTNGLIRRLDASIDRVRRISTRTTPMPSRPPCRSVRAGERSRSRRSWL